jgi:predicted MFS family arabinose efflux permease
VTRVRANPAIYRLLLVLSLVAFASSLSVRAVDPVIPLVAADLAVSTATAALLSTAFALPYALTQPVLGPIADMVGKTRFMTGCLVVLTAACAIGALAPVFALVLAARVVSGIVAGGVFPIAMAIIGDRWAIGERQVAIGRLLAAAMVGNLLGASLSGVIGDVLGWRGVFVGMGVFALLATVAGVVGFRGTGREQPARLDLAMIPANYRTVFANPKAKICYAAVFLEGVFVFGLFPYVAVLLREAGETRASIAGLVIAGFGVGGLCYSGAVSLLIARLGERRMMVLGGALVAGALAFVALDLAWPFQVTAFLVLGFGFFTLHGCIQLYATELAPTARASAMSLHSSSFFFGQAVGPLYYGLAMAQNQATASILLGGLAVFSVGVACARWLPQAPELPDQPRPR